MPISIDIPVCNPSNFVRHDYVEVDLARFGLPSTLADESLKLFRVRDGKVWEEAPFQIDYPFGKDSCPFPSNARGWRILTFFSRDTPVGSEHYDKTSVVYRLMEIPNNQSTSRREESLLSVEHYYSPGNFSSKWERNRSIHGVKLKNGNADKCGLEVYFSMVARPESESPINYSGSVTSVHHHRLCKSNTDCRDILSPLLFPPMREFARWGQLTRLDFYPLPWESRWYHSESLLSKNGVERSYSLLWSNVGSCRATVTFASEPFTLSYATDPSNDKTNLQLTCRLFRIISLYPQREFYTEQLVVRPEEYYNVSLAFRAHYQSYVDVGFLRPELARIESIPDYFAVWWRWNNLNRPYPLNLGYAFASDSHIRSLAVSSPEINWRLQLNHEHRTTHHFLYEPHHEFDLFHTVGHDAWYQQVFKRIEVIPLSRYVRY